MSKYREALETFGSVHEQYGPYRSFNKPMEEVQKDYKLLEELVSEKEEAVKPVKLSEVVERLKKECNDSTIDYSSNSNTIGYYYYFSNGRYYVNLVGLNNNKIDYITYDENNDVSDFKWLYSLWINGNEIINDLM